MGFSFKKILKKDKGEVISPKAAASRSSFVGKGGKMAQEESHKIKPFRATSGAKYALIIGDEGAILVYMVGKMVQSRNFIAHASADNLKEFETILSKNIIKNIIKRLSPLWRKAVLPIFTDRYV